MSKGGVEAGTKDSSDYIYVNSNDDAINHTLSINNSGNKSDWRIVAGDKFGVDKAGNLYTSGAYITDISASNISAGTLSADRIGAGTITADKLDATDINASNSLSIGALSSDAQNSVLNSKIYENAGYRYAKDIIIYGESNKYYPIYFNNNQDEYNQNVPHEILITRTYAEQAPDDWNTSTHKGGLTLNIKWNYGGWGGATYKAEILAFNEMYSTMVGDVVVGTGSGMLSAVYLRGGGSTGALYHIASDIKIDSTRYGSSFPLIGTTAGATIMQTGSYSWTVPSALTTPNTTHIDSLIAENTASSYITYINATDGIKIHNSSDTTNYARVNSDGLQVYKSDTQVASFGNSAQIGPDDNYHIIINNNGMQFLPAVGGQGGGEFITAQQGIRIKVSGTNKPVYPNTLGSLGLQNWSTSLNCYDYENNMSVTIGETQNSNNAFLSLSVNASSMVAGITLEIDKNKAWNAFDRGTIRIGDGNYGRQIHMATDVNIGGQNSDYDDGTGIFGSSYLYFARVKATKSTSSSYNAAYFFSDTIRSNNDLSSFYLGTLINSSSKRYKHNVNLLKDQTIDAHNLYNAEVVQFFYNDEYIDKKDCRYGIPLPGFIAEDLYEIYPVAVDINENGEPETWNERYIIPPMLKLIQEQHQEIQELRSEIVELKRRIK